ncbi:hypothetical protein [Commensalibacter papalotli (ex Servin-Garciduenas et al. 2014)]|uniref:Uncharacterized protein n=1 Tax=Commensalibacter papalotli (ex Servin-Garciduenas et al. 2014) TaxID=1208583 RepID=W7E162_9PROT|nr:hypothetical protein [Commensalibacter papalotli (ex Servin-Garciduenas et al. 2014)]EUK18779.1 hypothetical protein COMX_03485 [Commensalibacter papalotli (ex Servin-Garciduenas et al. 2014)]
MKSIFKLSLFAAAMTFAASNVAMAAPAHNQDAHKHYKGHQVSKKVKKTGKQARKHQQIPADQETADLNARSLQAVQTVNNGGNPAAVQQVVPNPEMQLPPSARVPLSGNQTTQTLNRDSMQDVNRYDSRGRRVIVAPGTGNTVAPPPPGAVNPNNMPPVQ